METCGEVMIQCTFPNCTARLRRSELDAHMASATTEHLGLARALSDELATARSTLDGLTVHVKVTMNGPPRTAGLPRVACLTLKYMQPIGEQPHFRSLLESWQGELRLEHDTSKSPHALGLRDGAVLRAKETAINLVVRDEQARDLVFKIRSSSPLVRLMTAFARHRGIDRQRTKFMFNGNEIEESDTPEGVGMEDGDRIDAYVRGHRN